MQQQNSQNSKGLYWPDILLTGVEPAAYVNDERRKWFLCSDGLTGWANLAMELPPANFGKGMAHIGMILNCVATGDGLMEWSKANPVPEAIVQKYANPSPIATKAASIEAPCGTITTKDRYAVVKPVFCTPKQKAATRYNRIYSKRTHAMLKDKFRYEAYEESTAKPYYNYYERLPIIVAPKVILPSNFCGHPWNSALQNSESESIARNVMVILSRTGNTWRPLTWEEYREERLKDGRFSEIEQGYFERVIDYCKSPDTAKLFAKDWYKE